MKVTRTRILGVAGIAMLVGAIFSAIKNAKEEVKEELDAEEVETDEEESKISAVIGKVKRYWLTIVLTCGAIFCFGFALHVSAKTTAAAMAAYKVAADTLDKHKEVVKDVVGERKESIISARAAEKMVDDNPIEKNKIVDANEEAETIFYDPLSKTYFRATVQEVKETVKRLNDSFIQNGGDRSYISYGRFRRALKIHDVKVPFDDRSIGWNAIDGDIKIGFDCMTKKNEQVVIVLSYRVMPYYDFVES